MKTFFVIPLTICLATIAAYAAPQTPTKVLLAQADHTSQIAQVKAGTLKTANASWWGFNKDDATQCLQDAINSGVSKLIVDNTGSDWIMSKPINLASNQEIHFADGVVIQARKGDFKGTKDALFNGINITNFALIGQGNVVFRMHREDYANPALYEKAEWRHGINLRDCSNAIFRNITVTRTGGDGLYLGATANGTNTNILVENMNFDANYRLGIAVISADGLTIRNCKLNNTLGTNPQAGIDFEPNYSGQRLANCLVENCDIYGNVKGGGIDLSPTNLDGNSQPISITFRNCTIGGNSVGVATNPSHPTTTNPATGKVTFIDCTFDHNQISLRDPVVGSIHYLFQGCTLDFSATKDKNTESWRNAPFIIYSQNPPAGRALGNITFDHVTVINDGDPLSLSYRNKATIADSITGTITLKQNNKTSRYDLAGFVKGKQDEFRKINEMVPATIDLNQFHTSTTSAARVENNTFYLRNKFTFLQYAQKDESITIDVTVRKIYDRETIVDLIDPSGNKIQSYTIPLNNKPFPITFTAAETGLYRVVRTQDFSQYLDITSAYPGNGLLAEESIEFLPLGGKLYFQVPAGVKDFTIGVSTDSTADVALVNPDGKEVERRNNVNSMHLFSATRNDASKSEIWSIDVSKPVWTVTVNLYEPLVPVVSTNPATLLLK